MISPTNLAVLGVVALGGLVRGATGFGASMVMTPLLSVLVGPIEAVVTSLTLEAAAAAEALPWAARRADWRKLLPIGLAAAVAVPIGGVVLVSLDRDIARRLIATVVIVLGTVLLLGFRYTGRQRLSTSLGLGFVSGTLLGATGIGAPPVILYLLSGPDDPATTRATLTLYVSLISLFGLMMLAFRGLFSAALAGRTLVLLLPLFLVGLWLGALVFARVADATFRTGTLLFVIVISASLLAF